MISRERVVAALSFLTLTLAGITITALGVAALTLCLFVRNIPAKETEFSWVSVQAFSYKSGITFLLIGLVVLFLSRKRRSEGEFKLQETEGTWRNMFVLSLLVLPVLALAASGPLLSLWSDALGLMERWGLWKALQQSAKQQFGFVFVFLLLGVGLALLVPLFEVATLAAFLGGSGFPLLLLRFKSQHFRKVFIIWVLVQVAFLAGSFYAIDLMSHFTPLFLDKVREFGTQPSGDPGPDVIVLAGWVRRHDQVVEPTAHRLAWVFLGYLIWVLALLGRVVWSKSRSNCQREEN